MGQRAILLQLILISTEILAKLEEFCKNLPLEPLRIPF